MTTQPRSQVSRRAAVASIAAGGAAAIASHRLTGASAQGNTELAGHPMVGIWLGITPEGPAPAFFMADGSFIGSSAPISAGADGTVTFLSPQTGVWEPDSDRGIHFTSLQSIHDTEGVLLGTVTVDGYPAASEDGESFYDDGTRARLTIRDASNTITMVLGEDGGLPAVYGNRMHPGEPIFHDGTPPAATPAT